LNKDTATSAQREPLLVSYVEASRLLGVSASRVHAMVESGQLTAKMIHRRRMIPREAIENLAR